MLCIIKLFQEPPEEGGVAASERGGFAFSLDPFDFLHTHTLTLTLHISVIPGWLCGYFREGHMLEGLANTNMLCPFRVTCTSGRTIGSMS